MKHKHYDLIIEWAKDTTKKVEYRSEPSKVWRQTSTPAWLKNLNYRFARPEWQKRLLDAVKSGRVVEFCIHEDWWPVSSMNEVGDEYDFGMSTEKEYRIKPLSVKAWSAACAAEWAERSAALADAGSAQESMFREMFGEK